MYDLDEILIQSVKVKASDIHLTTGRPPSYRIDGVLTPIEGERLTPQMLEDILMPLMDVRHREELQNNGTDGLRICHLRCGTFSRKCV